MKEGKILEYLVNKSNLSKDFLDVYEKRYDDSINFIDKILNLDLVKNEQEFYVSSLVINELFSAVRDEIRSVLMFNNGVPISMWKDQRLNPDISEEDYQEIYQKVLSSFDMIFLTKKIIYIPEQSQIDGDSYWDIISSILFLIKQSRTLDATLLTTAILNKADYFVTKDQSLIKHEGKTIKEGYNLEIINTNRGNDILNKMLK